MRPGKEASEDASPAVPGFGLAGSRPRGLRGHKHLLCRLSSPRHFARPLSGLAHCVREACASPVPTTLSVAGRTWKQPSPI